MVEFQLDLGDLLLLW